MKKLYESLLDNDEELFDRTMVKPTVTESDYMCYEQAWYNILMNIKDTKENLDLYIKWYLDWKQPYIIHLDLYNQYELKEIIKYGDRNELEEFLKKNIEEKSDWFNNQFKILFQNASDKIKNKKDIVTYFFWECDGLFLKIYRSKLYKNDPKTKEYYKYIKSTLKYKGMQFK